MMGASDGFTLRYDGGFGRPLGNSPAAALIAAWTSRAAPLMSRPVVVADADQCRFRLGLRVVGGVQRQLCLRDATAIAPPRDPGTEAIEIQINYRRGVEREKLREQ